jgi:membrane dipeptidase
MKRILAMIIGLFCVLCASILSQSKVKPDGEEALKHVRYLASDDFKGRKSGTPEYEKAAEYVAAKMEEYGLRPGNPDGTYFQQVDFKSWKHFDPPIRLEMIEPVPLKFRPGRRLDFFPNGGTGSGIVRAGLVYAGYGLISPEQEWDDYANLDVQNKIVLIIPGAPKYLESIPKKDRTLDKKVKAAVDKGAAGVLFMNVDEEISGYRIPAGPRKVTTPDGFVVMTANAVALDKVFYSAGLSWRTLASRSIREKKSSSQQLDIVMEMESHYIQENRTAPSVLGLLPGQDPELKDELIIIGAHLDHLGVGWDGTIFNGADDDASGIGVVLEIARVFQANGFQPVRSILFAGWAGEELGLIGSRYYTNHPLYPLEKTIYVNLDMVGTGDGDLYVGGMWEYEEFYDYLKKGMKEDMKERLRYRLAYRGSDHASFLAKGVTSISLRSGNVLTQKLDDEHPEYHRPGDDPAIIQPELLQLAAEYNHDILIDLATTKENLFNPNFRAQFLHKDAFVVDLHCDTIGRALGGVDLAEDQSRGHIDIPKLKQGAVDLQVFACFVGPPREEIHKHQAAKRVFDQIDAVHQLAADNPDDIQLILTPDDLRKLRGKRKTGVLISIEGGYAIENDLRLLRSFHRNGVRMMTLTHWLDTDWADASGDPESQLGGLTEFGEEVVKEMNRIGMIIDVSHVHDETFWDVMRLSEHPVVASHSCCRALSDVHRNLTDEMLKALAKNKGVIGICYVPSFLNAENGQKINDLRNELLAKHGLPEDRAEYAKADAGARKKFGEEFRREAAKLRKSLPPVDVKTVVDHIDHVVKITKSTSHVGLGSDFDGTSSTPVGLEHTGKLSAITEELVQRGYKESDIKKILGGNFLRVFRKVCGPKKKSDKKQRVVH